MLECGQANGITMSVIWSLFNVEQWDRANWRATLFMTDEDPTLPPCLGIAFENGEIGREVFRKLRLVLGDHDPFDELRISIVEGDVAGEAPGYYVHLMSEPDNTAKRIGHPPVVGDFVVASKVHRMNPLADSPYLPRFKRAIAHQNRYLVLPATFDGSTGTAMPHVELAIGKYHVYFRQVRDIRPGDPDAPVLSRR